MNAQARLLAIVRTWDPNPIPEFRGFRCANCQEYLRGKVWHHVLHQGEYFTPVHFCEKCEAVLENDIPVAKPKVRVDHNKFCLAISPTANARLDEISGVWDPTSPPILKPLACDKCDHPLENGDHSEGYHVWRDKNGILSEYHFHRECGHDIVNDS